MAAYREVRTTAGGPLLGYVRTLDGQGIPWPAPGNTDADEVRAWLALGNVADPPILPPPPPPVPDYGGDVDTEQVFWEQAQTAVQNLRAYIALSSPTAAQTVAVVKLLCRIVLFFIRRMFPGA